MGRSSGATRATSASQWRSGSLPCVATSRARLDDPAFGRRERAQQIEAARTMQLQPYLFFTGDCEEALEFYRSIFGGTIEGIFRYGGSPMESHVPPNWKNKIMHATFKSDGVILMAADSSQTQPGGENVRTVPCLSSADHDEGHRVFEGLAAGGTVTFPYARQFWGASFGTLTDKYGIAWMINAGGAESERG
jgi:PhnB protein